MLIDFCFWDSGQTWEFPKIGDPNIAQNKVPSNFRKLPNPKHFVGTIIDPFKGTLMDPFKGTPNFRKPPHDNARILQAHALKRYTRRSGFRVEVLGFKWLEA